MMKFEKRKKFYGFESDYFYEESCIPDIKPVSKEPYLLPQPEGLVRVLDLLFAETSEGGRCVLLRWILESEFPVDSITFELCQLDAADNCVASDLHTYGREELANLRKGDVFVPSVGYPLDDRCAMVEVKVQEAVSDRYVYRVKGTRVEAGYRAPEYWSYDKKPGREDDLSDKTPLRVTSKGRGRVQLLLPVVILSIVVMLLTILSPYIRPFIPEPEEETASDTAAVTAVADVNDAVGGFDEFMTMGEDGVVEYTTIPVSPTSGS